MEKKYLPVQRSKGKAFLLIGIILFIYALDNISIGSFFDYKVYSSYIKPMLWISTAGLVWALPRVRSKAPLKLRGNLCLWAFNFAVIFIIASVIAGLIDGFGKSPYDHSFTGIITNMLVVGSMLLGREAVRSFTVNSLARDEKFLVFITIAAVMSLSSYPADKFTRLENIEGLIQFAARFLAPEFLQNLLATYFSFLGGWIPAFIYMGTMQAFHWFSPVLPNLQWITAALVGIMCPAFSLAAIQGIYLKETKAFKSSDKGKEGLGGWILTSLFSIGIIWFSVGVFPVYPSVVATGSMEPMIKPGDVILVEKMMKVEDVKALREGDVIQFTSDGILISHRIIEIVEENGIKCYITKGDNNSIPDSDAVKPDQIRGRIIKVVPKIGWPTLLIKSKDDIPPDKVEF